MIIIDLIEQALTTRSVEHRHSTLRQDGPVLGMVKQGKKGSAPLGFPEICLNDAGLAAQAGNWRQLEGMRRQQYQSL
jgi:hypothetical protein